MLRQSRTIITPNTYYHVYNRGVNRRTIFREEGDYQRFLRLLDRYISPVGKLLSYALMRDYFHLSVVMNPAEDIAPRLLEKPHTLGNTFGHIQNAYARYFNIKYGTVSGLFEQNFERKEIDTLDYFRQLVVYHHFNPVKHGETNDFRNYWWTSHPELSDPLVESHVDTAFTLAKFGGLGAFLAAHEKKLSFPPAFEAEFGADPTDVRNETGASPSPPNA